MRSIEKINNELVLVIEVELKGVATENSFFNLMNDAFSFPAYYRRSFDSLDDCMRDLTWFTENSIVVRVKSITRVKDKDEALYAKLKSSFALYKSHWEYFKDKSVAIELS